MTDKKYNAKSADEHHGPITNREHCGKVSILSEKFGSEIGKSADAAVAGHHDGLSSLGGMSERLK